MVIKRDMVERAPPSSALEKTFGKSVLSAVGPEWKMHRDIVNPAFGESVLNTVAETAYANITAMGKKWEDLMDGKNQVTLPVADYMRNLTMNVISEVGFGVPLDNSFNPLQVGSFGWALKIVSTNFIMKIVLPEWVSKLPFQKN